MKNSHAAALAGFSIFAILVFAFGVLFFYHPSGTTTVTNLNGNGGGGTTCPAVAQVIQGSIAYVNYSKTPAQTQYAPTGGTISVYAAGSTNRYATGVFAGTAPVSISGVNCNTNYVIGAGNQTFLKNFSTVNTGTNVNSQSEIYVFPYTAPTLTFSNATTSAFKANNAQFHSASAGQTVTSMLISIQAGAGWTSEGAGALVMVYNSLAMQAPSIAGAQLIAAGTLPSPSYITSNSPYLTQFATVGIQNAYVAYSIPAAHNYQYATASGPSSSPTYINPTFTLLSGYGANEAVSVYWVAQTQYISPSTGAPAYSFINQTTQAALVPTTYVPNAILIT